VLPQFVDLTAFFRLLVGNRLEGVLAVLCTACALPFLVAAWRRHKTNPSLAWSGALTWTLILSPYVPVYDTILIIPSLIASVGALLLIRRNALGSMLLLFVWLAQHGPSLLIHVQLLTLAMALVGALEVAAITGGPRGHR
jgi:hypothetical protein